MDKYVNIFSDEFQSAMYAEKPAEKIKEHRFTEPVVTDCGTTVFQTFEEYDDFDNYKITYCLRIPKELFRQCSGGYMTDKRITDDETKFIEIAHRRNDEKELLQFLSKLTTPITTNPEYTVYSARTETDGMVIYVYSQKYMLTTIFLSKDSVIKIDALAWK